MSGLDAATFGWIGASLITFGVALFPLYARANTALAGVLLRGATALALFCGVVAVMLHVQAFGAAWTQMLATGIGRTWLVQLALAALLTAMPWRPPAWVAALLAALNVCGFALVGHADAIAGLQGAAVQALHLLAAGGWIGGLVALACALRETPDAGVVGRFSRTGLVFVVVLALTGVVVLFTNTGAALPMRMMRYGQFVWIKVGLFAAALALAALNRFVTAPRAAWRLMAQIILGELALLLAMVGVAVLLAQTEPYG